MNFREGIRRLALLVGCFGAITAGFGSYLQLKPVMKQRVDHDRFARLVSSDDVQKERKCRLLGYTPLCSQIQLPANATLVAPDEPKGWEPVAKQEDDFAAIAKPLPSNVPMKFNMEYAVPIPSELNSGEIKTINWSMGKNYTVESIETEDGAILHPTSLPSRWIYLLIVILPLAGFVLAWGLIRFVHWVGAGFLVKQESNLTIRTEREQDMEDSERKLLRTAFLSIFADLRQLKEQVDAATSIFEGSHPGLYAQYQTALNRERATTTNDHATLLEYLDKTLLRNTTP